MVENNYYAYKNKFKKLYKESAITCEKHLNSYYLVFNGQLDDQFLTDKILIIINIDEESNHFRIAWSKEIGNPRPLTSQFNFEPFQRALYGIPINSPLVKSRLKLIAFDFALKLHKERELEVLSLRHAKFSNVFR